MYVVVANIVEDYIEALLTLPRFAPGEVPQNDEWTVGRKGCDVYNKLTGLQLEAALYLGHVRPGHYSGPMRDEDDPGWYPSVTNTITEVLEHDPELIIMSARMKKLMWED